MTSALDRGHGSLTEGLYTAVPVGESFLPSLPVSQGSVSPRLLWSECLSASFQNVCGELTTPRTILCTPRAY